MKNDKLKFTKIEKTEVNEKKFHPVPIILTKSEYAIFKTYDENMIAKIIGFSICSIDKKILDKTEGIKIQLVINEN